MDSKLLIKTSSKVSPKISSKSLTILNYLAFFILFITSFVFIFKKNASILGYILALITNTAFFIYVIGEIMPNIDDYSYFIQIFATIAVISSAILHTVSLIFILIMIYNLHIIFTVNNGLPIDIPKPYDTQLYNFNIYMISVFSVCSVLVSIIKLKNEELDINFYQLLKNLNTYLFFKHFIVFLTFALSIYAIIMSSIQVSTANDLSSLLRKKYNFS